MSFSSVSPAALVIVAVAALAACAQTGPQSSSAKPVLYPNETFNRMGAQAAQAHVQACEGKAVDAGLTPRVEDNAVARSAAHGAAVGGTLGAVAGIFNGGISRVAENAAKGVVAGGATGAVSGSFNNDKPNPIYRNFVSRCVQEKGLEVIGWN
ncbi:glycine zipper family protein [Aquabacterium soli]|uniref:Glycine zipper family protein n=1 Tax=Aquabacterium soli TaxID=2493092 RepID=A0A3R8TT80_9BURK|nr:glycine zipper family protein [Aquabacterium soli]RRS04292.1 glycine zipper family protein [Aquabacterium soli]